MNFKNYVKITISNYASAWKLLIYRIIVWLFVLALMAPFYAAIKDVILANWNFDLFKEVSLAGLFYGKNVALTFASVLNVLVGALTMLFTDYLAAGIYLSVVLFIVRPFLLNIGRYVVSETIYGYMSSQSKHGFCSSLIRTLKNSTLYSILRTLFNLPFIALTGASFYLLTYASTIPQYVIAMPFIFLVAATLILSFNQILTMGWAPAMVVSGQNVFKSFGIGIKASFRGFGRSVAFAVTMTFFCTLFALGFGVFSLIIIVPVYAITSSMYETMHFFICQGMRYYTDKNTVLSSKKLEEQDTIYQVKYLL